MRQLDYLLPPFLADIFRYWKNLVSYNFNLRVLQGNKKFKDWGKGKSIYVIANGPSLKNYDIESLYGKDVIVMNHFELADWKDKVNIVAHCFGEPANSPAWEDPMPIFEGTDALSNWTHVFNKPVFEKFQFTRQKSFCYVAPIVPARLWPRKKKINLDRPTLNYQTTAQLAIMVALYMNYNKIFLLGFDHDWLSQRGISPHFYEEKDDVPNTDLSKFSYYTLLCMVKNKWEIYFKLKGAAEVIDSRIVNLSRPTYLDIFDYN